MGYQTRYTLKVDLLISGKVATLTDDTPLREVIRQFREECEEAQYALDDDGGCSGNESKWYEHKADMQRFSEQHPGILFTLSGEGEENADIWKEYYLNGKAQIEKAQLQIADFNPAKLV